MNFPVNFLQSHWMSRRAGRGEYPGPVAARAARPPRCGPGRAEAAPERTAATQRTFPGARHGVARSGSNQKTTRFLKVWKKRKKKGKAHSFGDGLGWCGGLWNCIFHSVDTSWHIPNASNMHHETDWKMYQNARKSNVGPVSDVQEILHFSQICQEHCREAKGQPRIAAYQAVEEPEKAASFTVLDGLKGCEAALTAMDRRVTNLEDCLEEICGGGMSWWCLDDVMWYDMIWWDAMIWWDEMRCNDMVHVVWCCMHSCELMRVWCYEMLTWWQGFCLHIPVESQHTWYLGGSSHDDLARTSSTTLSGRMWTSALPGNRVQIAGQGETSNAECASDVSSLSVDEQASCTATGMRPPSRGTCKRWSRRLISLSLSWWRFGLYNRQDEFHRASQRCSHFFGVSQPLL